MSKLTKFKTALTVNEASELLSKLIDEPTTTDDIEALFSSSRIGMIFQLTAQVMLLTEELQNPDPIIEVRSFQEPTTPITICKAIHLPSEEIYIRSADHMAIHRAIALRDAEGNFYALRIPNSGEHENFMPKFFARLPEHFPIVKDGFVEPAEIYRIANEANQDLMPNYLSFVAKRNNWCLGGVELYNYQPSSKINEVGVDNSVGDSSKEFPYMTVELVAMQLAANHFWINYEKERAPLQKSVSNFIAEKLGLVGPNRKTDALAAAIRPNDAPGS